MNNSAIWYGKDDTIMGANYLFNHFGIYVFQFILHDPVNSGFILFVLDKSYLLSLKIISNYSSQLVVLQKDASVL